MKLTKRKMISGVMALVIALSANVYAAVLHKERTEEIITKGVTLIKEQVLSDQGWQDIRILKVDLKDENVAVRPIESSNLGERKTVLDMVNNNGAIAGINADYFDTATSNTPSFGMVISDGTLKHAYNNKYSNLGPAKNMATFLINADDTAVVDYYGTDMMLYADGYPIGGMAAYNNIPSVLSRPIVLDSTYEQNTSKVISKFKGTYTVVVEDDIVTYLAAQDEVVSIPHNGYVILINQNDANAYYGKLPIGAAAEIKNTVYLKEDMTKAIEDIKLGVGGSGIIMKDGEAYTGAAHKVTPDSRAPRTVIATRKGSEEILLITVDGRGKTLGMNHTDLITLLQSYTVEDAMYFDGGGSTTLVSRQEGEKEVKLQNTPSDGAQRKVVNGVGVFTTSQPGKLNKLYIESANDRTFVGEPVSFTLKGVDENYNPVELNQTDVKLTVSGVSGTFKERAFYPETAGKALVIASYNGIETAKEIYISNGPVGIRIEPSNLQLSPNSSKNVQIYGIDNEGYRLPITADKVTWESTNKMISAKGNQIAATEKTIATLTASYKGVTAKLGVIVGDTANPIESFETSDAKWGGDTTTVQGKVEVSKDVKYHGNRSIKMTYTFAKTNNKQVAYTLFKEPITVPDDAMSINMWVNAKKQGDAAKIEITDAAGKKFYLKLTDSLNFEGWKYLSVALPKDMTLPAKITKFYTYANITAEKRTSAVYIDHLSVTRGLRDKQGITVRADYQFDPLYKNSLQAPKGSEYQINVMGTTKIDSMVLSKEAVSGIGSQLSGHASLVLLASQNNIDLPFSVPHEVYNNTHKATDVKDTKVIFAGTDKGGLRITDPNGWIGIKKDLENTSAKNIILIMSRNPLTQFDDTAEGLALHKYLKLQKETTGKNIFVVYTGGSENEVRIEDGIRYIRTSGFNVPSDNIKDCSYVKFKIVGNAIYYTFEAFN
jgi:exopolysaccharide biosynthesis protein